MINKNLLRSAGLAAGFLGLIAFAPSSFAQYQEQGTFWNGATPSAPGPGGASGPMYGAPAQNSGWGPNYGGWAPSAAGNPGPYWLGAPQALGPGM
jgi:hypothetical protein